MKKILVFFFIFCFQLGNAEVGDVYYCIEKYNAGVENFADGPTEKKYKLQKFSFKREANRLVFNKNADNSWNDFIMYHIKDYSNADILKETFAAWDEKENPHSILRYEDGNFVYASNFGFMATYSFAECTTF